MTTTQPNIDPVLLKILEKVFDPEIPVLSIVEMGVVRNAEIINNVAEVTITSTYSGYPAMDVIGDDIEKALTIAGYASKLSLVFTPPWTSDWITQKGRKALENYGIAAPLEQVADKNALLGNKKLVKCPHCGSLNTNLISQFGSTACKALFQCLDCSEPFDYFKCLK